MARLNVLGVPSPPKERDYAETPQGALRYTADALEWMQTYVDATDDHRKGNIGTIGQSVVGLERDLQPDGSKNPGWVANSIRQVADDNAALLADNERIRSQLKWQNRLVVTTLVAMLIFLGQQLIVRL
jgi:hypothetical protein